MTYQQRNQILQSPEFIAQCRIALCDWLEYWTVNGLSPIEDEDLRTKTDIFIRNCLANTETYVFRIATIVIGTDIIENAEEITDSIVKRAVDTVLSHALDFLI